MGSTVELVCFKGKKMFGNSRADKEDRISSSHSPPTPPTWRSRSVPGKTAPTKEGSGEAAASSGEGWMLREKLFS